MTPQNRFAFIREGFTKLTPSQASLILRECAYERQRNIDKAHVSTLREHMRLGLWADKDKLDFARLPNGTLVLVNGYHRMSAQAATTIDILWTVAIHSAQTIDDVHALYFKFDTNLRRRSDANIVQAVGFAERHGLTKTIAKAVYAAVPTIAAGMVIGNRPPGEANSAVFMRRITDLRLEQAERLAPMAARYQTWIEDALPGLRKKLLSVGVVSVALVTAHHEQAEEFWRGLSENDGLRRGDPRNVLALDLMSRHLNQGSVQQSLYVTARAWNAFAKGEQLKIIKVYPGSRIKIIGTDYEVRV